MISPEHKQLLEELGTTEIEHSRRTFFDHLVGVHDLLKDWGNEDDLCIAGLFHSAYGTQDFKTALLGYHKRARLKKALGVKAENLAYLFSVSDRRTFFANLANIKNQADCKIVDMVTKQYVTVNYQDMLQLIELEVANWLDQAPPLEEASESGLAPIRSVMPMLDGLISHCGSKALARYFAGESFRGVTE